MISDDCMCVCLYFNNGAFALHTCMAAIAVLWTGYRYTLCANPKIHSIRWAVAFRLIAIMPWLIWKERHFGSEARFNFDFCPIENSVYTSCERFWWYTYSERLDNRAMHIAHFRVMCRSTLLSPHPHISASAHTTINTKTKARYDGCLFSFPV